MTRLRDLTADRVRVRDMIGTARDVPSLGVPTAERDAAAQARMMADHRARHASTAVTPRACIVCGEPATRAVRVPTSIGVGRVGPVCDACPGHRAMRRTREAPPAGITYYRARA